MFVIGWLQLFIHSKHEMRFSWLALAAHSRSIVKMMFVVTAIAVHAGRAGKSISWLGCSCWVRYGWDWSFYKGQCRGKASFVLTLITEAVWCEVVSTHTQANMNRSWHVVLKYETQPLSLLLFFRVTTEWNTAVSPLDTLNFTLGMNAPLSDISYHCAEEVGLW